ncbi:MAG TPA: RNA-processing protein [Candidatus Altiarchaeales archaeon]|nr:RNA-processing protein [Candidatus Altiarchaeales archaeon]
MQFLRIPKDRIGALIGVNGKVKKEIEKRTNTKITVEDGNVSVDGDSLGILTARDIVMAIGRGFSPEIAFRLFNEDTILEVIRLSEILSSERDMLRKKGRVIGRKGKMRRIIEGMTNTHISVYGKTIGIIGSYENVDVARDAILKLIHGARHSSIYRFLEKSIRDLKESQTIDIDELYKDMDHP